MKLKFVKDWQKKIKRFNTIANVLHTGLTTSTVITGALSIVDFLLSTKVDFFLLQQQLRKNPLKFLP